MLTPVIFSLQVALVTTKTVIWSLYIGLMIATFLTYYVRRILGGAISAISKCEAYSIEKAVTLREMGIKNIFVINSLLRGSLKKYITAIDSEGMPADEKTPKDERRYYIPESLRNRAELRFSSEHTDIFGIIIAAVVFLVIAILLALYLDKILGSIKNYY